MGEMKFNIPKSSGEYDIREAALLVQRLVPCARIYRDIYLIRKTHSMEPRAKELLEGVLEDISEHMTTQLLCFIGENPFDIPDAQNK